MPLDPKKVAEELRKRGTTPGGRETAAPEPTPAPAAPTPQIEQQGGDRFGTAKRLAGVLFSGEALAGAVGLPSFPELPFGIDKPIRFGLDLVASPVGLASLIAFPIAPGLSFAGKIAADVAVGTAATLTARATAAIIPEDAPRILQFAPLLTGFIGAGALGGTIRGAVRQSQASAVAAVARAVPSEQTALGGFVRLRAPRDLLDSREQVGVLGVGRINQLLKNLNAAFQINPSANDSTFFGTLKTAYIGILLDNKKQTQIVLDGTLPGGFKAFNIVRRTGRDGATGPFVEGLKNQPDNLSFTKLMSINNAPARFAMNAEQTTTWNEARRLIDEGSALLDDILPGRRKLDLGKDELYFPQQPLDKRGKPFPKVADPLAERLWNDTGPAVLEGGLSQAMPEEVMRMYLETVLELLTENQLNLAVLSRGVTPNAAARATRSGKDAHSRFVEASRSHRDQVQRFMKSQRSETETGVLAGTGAHPNVTEVSLLNNTESNFLKAGKEWSRQQETIWNKLPGHLFRGGTDATDIPVIKYKGKFFADEDGIDDYRRWMRQRAVPGADTSAGIDTIRKAGDFMRFTAATYDVAAPFVNFLPLFGTNPVAWGRVAHAQIRSMFNAEWQGGYIRKNFDSIDEMVRHGGVDPGAVELFKAIEAGGFAEQAIRSKIARATGLSAVTRAAQRGYDGAMLVGRHAYWQALRPTWKGSLGELGKLVRNHTGALEPARLGVTPSRRAVESFVLFAPRLMRSTIALVADATRPWTPVGAEAAHSLLRLAAVAMSFTAIANVAQGIATGMTEEQLNDRLSRVLNPLKGREFLSIKIGDKWYGVGGQVRSIAQFMTRAVSGTITEGPKHLLTADAFDNPLLRYSSGRLSPAGSVLLGSVELVTGEKHNILPFEEIDSFPDVVTLAARGMLPFAVQAALEDGLDFGDALEVVGPRATPATPTDRFNVLARRRYGLDFADLTDTEQDIIKGENPDIVERQKTFGGREEKEWRRTKDEINDETNNRLKLAVEELDAGQSTTKDFREQIEGLLGDRVVRQEQAMRDFGVEFGPANTPRRIALDAYFQTFEDAKRPSGEIDWERWEELQQGLNNDVQAGLYGDPTRIRAFIDERRRFPHPAELDFFFEAKDVIRESGYWDLRDDVFEQLFRQVAQRTVPGARSARDMDLALTSAQAEGDTGKARRIQNTLNRMDSIVARRRLRLRRQNRALDQALNRLGYVTRVVSLRS